MPFSWDAFLARYRPLGHHIAVNLSGRPAEADDVVQEAAVSLWTALRRDPERFETMEHARNYFLRAIKNLATKRRFARAGTPIEGEPEAPEAANDDAWSELRGKLAELVRGLDPDERALLARRYHLRQTLAEVALETGLPVSTVHSRERALLARLRRSLTRFAPEVTAALPDPVVRPGGTP